MTSTVSVRLQDNTILSHVSQKNLKSAFLLLEGKYEKSVHNTILKLVQDKNTADRLTKMTFYKVLNTVENCNTSSGFARCVYKTCADVAMEFLVKEKNRLN